MTSRPPALLRLLAPALLLAAATPAAANPKKLPFSYGPQTMPAGHLEVEQYVDLVPLRVTRERSDGTLEGIWSTRYQLQTELELGLTDRLELGVYLVSSQSAEPDSALRFDGIKERIRFRFSDPATWPIGAALYLEVVEFRDEIEFEEKLLLSWSRGLFELTANLWVEQEYDFADGEWKFLYNPTAGATWEISPAATVGLEYWARGRFDEAASGEPVPTRHYLGPTLMLQRGEYWLSLGAYLRAETGDIAIGDPYGRVWVRMILGLGL